MKAHRTDRVSLTFALVFLAVVGWWLLHRFVFVHLTLPNAGWWLAIALIVIGVLGLFGTLRSGHSARGTQSQPGTEPASQVDTEPVPTSAEPVPQAGAEPVPPQPGHDPSDPATHKLADGDGGSAR